VEGQLGRSLTDDELPRLAGRIAKASVIVEGYIGIVYQEGDTIPDTVTIVVASMVARLYETTGSVMPGQTAEMVMAGPHQWQRSFGGDANSVEPWLTKADRIALQNLGSGMVSVQLGSERR
jgi:hypothetical protein